MMENVGERREKTLNKYRLVSGSNLSIVLHPVASVHQRSRRAKHSISQQEWCLRSKKV